MLSCKFTVSATDRSLLRLCRWVSQGRCPKLLLIHHFPEDFSQVTAVLDQACKQMRALRLVQFVLKARFDVERSRARLTTLRVRVPRVRSVWPVW